MPREAFEKGPSNSGQMEEGSGQCVVKRLLLLGPWVWSERRTEKEGEVRLPSRVTALNHRGEPVH